MDRLADLVDDDELVADALLVHFREDTGVTFDPLETDDGLVPSQIEPAIPVVSNLRTVEGLPWIEAAFFAVLTIGALVLLLGSAWRGLRHELATMRVLGLRPRQAAATLGWQATVLAVISLVIGIPLGLAAGNTIWRAIARGIPVLYQRPVPQGALLVVVPATVAVAVVLALLPARRAARLSPSAALRTE
jgi:hypothetical protein